MRIKSLAATAAIALLGFASPSWASIVTHSFDVVLSGVGSYNGTYSGTFSYDSSSITPGASNSATGLLTDLSFNLLGTNYDETNANTGFLGFDAQGNLNNVLFGTNCGAGSCSAPMGDWWFSWSSAGNNDRAFQGNFVGEIGGVFNGATSVSAAVPEPVPLPATAWLLLSGLGALGLSRRRRPN